MHGHRFPMFFLFLLQFPGGCGKESPTEPSTTEPSTTEPPTTTDDQDGDGFEAGPDCDDGDAQIHPGADEVCGGGDEDCDGIVDEDDAADASTWYADDDGDGYGSDVTTTACDPPADQVANSDDCDDGAAGSSPAGTEVCGGGDEDCDGAVDEDDAVDASTWYADGDGDGYGSDVATVACAAPVGHVANSDDCDDGAAGSSPAGTEVCGGADEDCDGTVDFGFSVPATFATIQGAIDAATDGDHLCVAAGNYPENLVLADEDLVIEGYDGADATIVDGGGVGVVLTVQGASTLDLSGLTLRNGFNGGGLLGGAGFEASGPGPSGLTASLEDVIIEDNVGVDTVGVALFLSGDVEVALTDVEIRGNSASGRDKGSMIFVSGASLTLDRVAIVDNEVTCETTCAPVMYAEGSTVAGTNVVVAGNSGVASDDFAWMYGLLVNDHSSTLDLESATITGNRMEAGDEWVTGTVHLVDGAVVALNNVVIADNDYTGTNVVVGGIFAPEGLVTVTYTDVSGNASPEWYGLLDPAGTNGNLSVAPGFTDVTSADPLLWDLTLAAGSPLLDAGDPALLDADGSRSDLGAYGGPGGAW